MARATLSLLAGGILLFTGCAMMPSAMKKPEGHATEETAAGKRYGTDDDSTSGDPFANKARKKQDEEEDASLMSTEENPFAKSRQGAKRSKESDFLTKILDSFSDPRKAEINRDLGID
ncbi:MAG: hypothetical protein U0903_18425 [Planctomycetales bacterium]